MLCLNVRTSLAPRLLALLAMTGALLIGWWASAGDRPDVFIPVQDNTPVLSEPPHRAFPVAYTEGDERPTAAQRVKRPAPVGYYKTIKRGIPLHVVQADLRSSALRVTVATAGGGIGTRDHWSRIIDRTRPTAAMTGTYFDLQTALPVSTIIVGGRLIHWGRVGSAFVFDSGGTAAILPAAKALSRPYETVVRAGPRLLVNGEILIEPWMEGFTDPAIYARKRRAVVGITRANKLVFIGVDRPVQLRPLARALRDLGVKDALCMDGGNSAGLYYRGKSWVVPKRSLTNLLLIYDNPERYIRYANVLVPNGPKLTITLEGMLST